MTIRFGLAGLRHPHLESLLAEDDPAVREEYRRRLGGDEVITATRVALLAQTTANSDAWQPWQATLR